MVTAVHPMSKETGVQTSPFAPSFETPRGSSHQETIAIVDDLLRDVDLDDIVCNTSALQSEDIGPCCIY